MPKFVVASLIAMVGMLVNVPLGYWRASVQKFSKQWFIAVHLSVPVIFLLRVEAGVGVQFIPLMVLAAIIGQVLGAKVKKAVPGIEKNY